MKVLFLVDGFNLYHSILKLKEETGYAAKWLDVFSLCKSYLHLFGRQARLEKVYYFSALPTYLSIHNPAKIARHQSYINCLESTGVQVILGRFKNKDVFCHRCKSMILKHEEKETDVAIAVKLFEVLHKNECDLVVIISGDTDLVPAIKTCTAVFNSKKIIFAFPFGRKSKELMKLAPGSFVIGKNQYAGHLFPNVVKTGVGDILKPVHW